VDALLAKMWACTTLAITYAHIVMQTAQRMW